MKASTGSGPSRSMRARKSAARGLSPLSSALDIGPCRNAPAGGAHDDDPGQHHRQRIEDPGGEGTDGEQMADIGLAEELAERTGQTVADQEGAGRQAWPAQ